MKRKIISFGDKYTIYDSKDLKIGELNHSSFKHGIHELVYKDEAVDYVLKKIELLNRDYYLEKNGWVISPNDLSTEYKVFDGQRLIMIIERIISLKIEKYDVKVFDENNLYLCALVSLSAILLSFSGNHLD